MKPTQTHQSYESKEGIYIRTACVNLGTLPYSLVIQFYAILHWSNSWNTFDGFESWHQCSLPNLPGHIKSRHVTREVLYFRQSNRGQNAMRNEHEHIKVKCETHTTCMDHSGTYRPTSNIGTHGTSHPPYTVCTYHELGDQGDPQLHNKTSGPTRWHL